ncbi:MAG: glycoside hydrolase family 18 protein [Inhella sp.]
MRSLLICLSLLLALGASAAESTTPVFGAGLRPVQRQGEAIVGVYVLNERGSAAVDQLQPGSASHLLYAFLRLCGPGQLSADAAACAGQTDFMVAPDPRHGVFDAAFRRLKVRQPGLQVLASVGGWGGSDPFFHLVGSSAGRAALVRAMQDFLRAHPSFDGIDIDWEHPGSNGAANGVQLGSADDGRHFALLMQELRAGLDALGRETGRRYPLTVAVNATAAILDRIDWKGSEPALDLIFVMSYDYHGAWTPRLGHHTPLRSSRPGADDSLTQSIAHFRRLGVPASKLVAGVGMYGRGFSGAASDRPGSRRAGLFPPGGEGAMAYREIAERYLDRQGKGRGGFEARFNATQQAWHLYDPRRRLYLAYDDPRAVEAKAAFAREQGLAGVFAWELTQDNGDLLNAMNRGAGHLLLPR